MRKRVELRGRATIARSARITVARGARVIVEDGAVLEDGCRIDARNGTIRIGPRARVGERAVLVAHAGIDVGADAIVGDWALIADAGPNYGDPERPIRMQGLNARPVTIGNGAVLGVHAAVLADVAAGATVTPYAVVDRASGMP
jgi:acetyltransferase-like isoleucine patch superfamily enzyme